MGLFRKMQKPAPGEMSPVRKYVLKQPAPVVSTARDWTQDLATRKQLRYIAEFGESAPDTLKKGQAGAILDGLIAKFPKIVKRHERKKARRSYDRRQELKEQLAEATRQLSAAQGTGNVLHWREEVESLKTDLSHEPAGCLRPVLTVLILSAGGVVLARFNLFALAIIERSRAARSARQTHRRRCHSRQSR